MARIKSGTWNHALYYIIIQCQIPVVGVIVTISIPNLVDTNEGEILAEA